jgi:hypothetical protein
VIVDVVFYTSSHDDALISTATGLRPPESVLRSPSSAASSGLRSAQLPSAQSWLLLP